MTFTEWWKTMVEEAEQGPTPEEETFAHAAWNAGFREATKLFAKDAQDAAAERSWQERQGDEYGSY